MRVKVYSIGGPWTKKIAAVGQNWNGEYILDKDFLHCTITVKDGKGSFKFTGIEPDREKYIREKFESGSCRFVAGGEDPGGGHWDAMERHPAWTPEAIESIVKYELYASSLGATIEYDKWDRASPSKAQQDGQKEQGGWLRFWRKWWSKSSKVAK